MPGHKSDYSASVTLKFNADADQAKKELQELQKQLNSLGTLSNPKVGDKLSADMQKASQAAAKLKIALDSAIDVDTGKLDLSKFSRSLKESGMNLKDYRNQLMSMGPEGEKAFTQVANSILKAEAPLRRTSKLVDTMWTTFKNTVRWELSSSILHGLESSLQKAVTYAQDLNKSLTDIRIVTGYSTDYMANFAVEANKAAKALSTTTTEYTNASLIYFQQGLDAQAVKERTDVTTKMANVTRESAEVVSDQMTAIWNNFDDGSKSLEYYADVITALGAATASSTDEISEGLEKFAAVASTVGLSYEYATSALATITSNTRQSADVVGTALKTLFARIQGLSLGETLEDGTDLNKYSEALASVGISIKESNGELKAMDDILDEMAAKWDTISNDQQVALAQTVAGVRQYTQLVALMDNWDKGDEDSMVANLNTSANATGALQEQADIYAESWEAARDRVTAALESIFNKLLKDEFFIDTLNSIEKIITGIDKFIDSIGGLQGVLTGLGAVATKVFSSQISSGLQNLAYNLNFGAAKERDKQMRIDAANAESSMLVDTHPGQSEAYKKIGKLQVMMIERADQMSDTEKELANHTIERYKNLAKQTEELAKQVPILKAIAEQADNEVESGKREVSSEWAKEHGAEYAIRKDYDKDIADIDKYIEELAPDNKKERELAIAHREELKKERDLKIETSHAREQDQQELISRKDNLKKAINQRDIAKVDASKAERENKILEKQREELKALGKDYSKIDEQIKENVNTIENWTKNQDELNKAVKEAGIEYKKVAGEVKGAEDMAAFENASITEKMNEEAPDILKEVGDEAEEQVLRAKGNMQSFADGIVGVAEGITSLTFGLQSLGTIWDTIGNPDMTGMEKFTSILTTLGFAIPSIIGGLTSLTSAVDILKKANITSLPSLMAYILGIELKADATAEDTKQEILNAIAKKLNIAVSKEEILTVSLLTKKLLVQAASWMALHWWIFAIIAAVWLLIGAYKAYQASTPEAQLKKTKEETEALKEMTDQAEQSCQKLKDTISSYSDARTALESLTQETEEFKEKVKEANASARELIETLGLTYGTDYTINSQTGLVEINEDKLKEKENAAEESVEAHRAAEYSSRNREKELESEIAYKNFIGETRTEEEKNTVGNPYAQGKVRTEAFGTLPVNSTVSDTEFKDYAEKTFAMIDKEMSGDIDKFLVSLTEGSEEFDKIKKDLFGTTELSESQQAFINKIKENTDSFNDLYDKVKANEAAIDANTRSLIQQSLENEKYYQDSEFKATIIAEAAKAYQEAYDAEKSRLEGLDEEALYEEFARIMGYTDTEQKDEDGERIFKNALGEEVSPSLDQIIAILSGMAGDEASESQGELTSEQMAKLAQKNPELASFVEQQNGGSQMSYTDQIALQKSLQGGLSNEDAAAQAMGYQNVKDMRMAQHYGAEIDWEQYNDYTKELEGLNPYADLEAAFQSDLKEQMAQRNYLSGRSADDYDITESDPDYTAKLEELKGLFSGLSEEEMKIMVSADLDLTKSKEEIQKDIQEVLQAAELEDTYKRTAEATGWSEDAIKSYAQSLMATNDKLADNELLAAKAAEQNLNFAKGAQDASEIFEDQAKVLAKADENSMEYHEAIGKLTASLNQMLGAKFDSNFLKDTKNMEKFKKAVKGDVDAIKELRKEAAKSVVAKLELKDENFRGKIQSLVSQIQDSMNNLQVGDNIAPQFIAQLNQMVQAAGMTKAQIEELMNSMGLHAEIEMEVPEVEPEEQKVESKNTANSTVTGSIKVGDTTQEIEGNISTTTETTSNMLVPVIKGAKVASTPSSLGSAAASNSAPSSGGGGGGGDKGEELKDPKNYEDEIERYHENTRALERLERALDKVTTAKDRAFGKERLRLIDEEIAATEKLAAQQKSYLAEIEGYAAIDRSRMEGYGFTFDEHGEITNYNEVYRQQVDKFNASRTDEAEEAYNDFKETVEQYEETITLLDEEQMKYQEYLNSIVDLKLEKITTEVEVKIRVNDIELTRLEYMLKKLQREGAAAADEIKNIADQINETMEKAGPIQEAIDKIYEQARAEGRGLTAEETAEIQSFYNDGVIDAQEQERINAIYAKADEEDRMLTQAEEDQIQEYKEQLLELNEEVWELADAIEGKLGEELDELDAEFDESLNRLTSYTQMYENLQNVLELTGKSKTAEGLNALNQLSASTLKNSTNALKANKANYDTFVELAAEANRHLQEAIEVGDQHMIDYWTEQVEDVTIRMEEAHVAMLESFNDALEAAGDLFDTKVQNMITKLKKDLGDLDTMVELYDRAVELENLYLSSNQSIYELSKLTREVGKSIEDTSNLIAKNKLNDLMKELNKLRAEGVQLSKYDLEYLQAKYELELAEIALQEAQEAKSQVKLTRNNEGGWGYVYTADSEKIAEAEQNFEDKTYNMQQLNADYITDYSEQLLKNRQEMMDALANIDKTREDYDAEVLRVKEEYMSKEEFYVSELTKAYERQGVAYEDTILGMISNDESLLESHENFKDRTLELIDEELIPAHEEWLENVEDICEEAGYSYDELTDGVLENMDSVNEASTELTEKTLQEQEDMRESMKETMQEIKNWQLQYLETIDAMVAANEAYYDKTIADYTNAMEKIVATAEAAFDAIVNAAQAAAAAVAAAGGGDEGEGEGKGKGPDTSPDVVKVERYSNGGRITYYEDGTTSGSSNGGLLVETITSGAGDPGGNTSPPPSGFSSWTEYRNYTTNQRNIQQATNAGLLLYDTGGYTGSWGEGWKLAGLHEKELVLNKHDTKNMLDMVNTLRDIDWRAKIDELWDNIGDYFITPVIGQTEELLQEVHIEANFPDLKDHFEIEEAFHNLINTASQYANRKLY